MKTKLIILMILSMIFVLSVAGSENAHWRGPKRDGIYPGNGLLKSWPEGGPQLLWDVDILGEGYSSPAVTKDRVYITGMIEENGFVFSFDHNGDLIWKTDYGQEWADNFPGARTTPTIVENHVYVKSSHGRVVCINSKDGAILWVVDVKELFDAPIIDWGLTESLLVHDEQVICTVGGPKTTLVALNRFDGGVIWKSASMGQTSSYASPALVIHNGRKLIVTAIQRCILCVDAVTGEQLWSHPQKTDWNVNANTPIYHDGMIYCTSGYGTGSVMLKLSKDATWVNEVWRNPTLDSQMGGAVLIDGYIYGSGQNKRAWHCLDWETGKVQYSDVSLGSKGAIIFANDRLYVYSEKGDVGLIHPNPQSFDVVSSFKVKQGSGEHWAHPVIADGVLYIRHGNALMAYNIRE